MGRQSLEDSLSGVVKAAWFGEPCGQGVQAEAKHALEMTQEHMKPGQILAADSGYDCRHFAAGLRAIGMRAHPRSRKFDSAIDGRTTRKDSNEKGMRVRHKAAGVFGWLKA